MKINGALIKVIVESDTLEPDLMDIPIVTDIPLNLTPTSICQFGVGATDLTMLGFINGILPQLTGKLLVKKIDEDTDAVSWAIWDESEIYTAKALNEGDAK